MDEDMVVSHASCLNCFKDWRATHPRGLTELECPECGCMVTAVRKAPMEILNAKRAPHAICSFCDSHIGQTKVMFKGLAGLMCPLCIPDILDLMRETPEGPESA